MHCNNVIRFAAVLTQALGNCRLSVESPRISFSFHFYGRAARRCLYMFSRYRGRHNKVKVKLVLLFGPQKSNIPLTGRVLCLTNECCFPHCKVLFFRAVHHKKYITRRIFCWIVKLKTKMNCVREATPYKLDSCIA